MKINQLFNKAIPEEVALRVVQCFNLISLSDRRMFCKYDLELYGTLERLQTLVPELSQYYMPCKARTYLHELSGKKCITVLKQIIRLHGITLISRERNVQGRKVIFYQMMGSGDHDRLRHMTSRNGTYTVNFV
jgi:hypothetical protein